MFIKTRKGEASCPEPYLKASGNLFFRGRKNGPLKEPLIHFIPQL
jgi:hypothetical protein